VLPGPADIALSSPPSPRTLGQNSKQSLAIRGKAP